MSRCWKTRLSGSASVRRTPHSNRGVSKQLSYWSHSPDDGDSTAPPSGDRLLAAKPSPALSGCLCARGPMPVAPRTFCTKRLGPPCFLCACIALTTATACGYSRTGATHWIWLIRSCLVRTIDSRVTLPSMWEQCLTPWCEFLGYWLSLSDAGLASVLLSPFWLPISIVLIFNCSSCSCFFIGLYQTLARAAGQPWRRSQVSSSLCSPAFGHSEKLRYSVKWIIRMWVHWTYLVCTLHMTLDIHVVIPLTHNLTHMNLVRMTLFCLFPSCSIPFSTVYTVTLGYRSDSTTHFGAVCGCVSLGVCCPILDKLS